MTISGYKPLYSYRPKIREARKCKNCGKKMRNAHPNKKFCSNKGVGNCKDDYHNRTNPRGYKDDIEHGHPFAAGYFGHGQE